MDGISQLFAPGATPDRPLPACNDADVNSRPPRLFQLPAELRLEIYDHVLRQSHRYNLRSHGKKRFRPRRPLATALLLVCNTIYYEFAPIFYAASTVVFRCDRDLLGRYIDYMNWLRALHDSLSCNKLARSTLHHARKLHVCIDTPMWPAASHLWMAVLELTAAKTAGCLRELTLTFYHSADLPPTNDDSDDPEEQLVGPLWPADKPGSEPDKFEHHRSVDLSANKAFAETMCAFYGLERLDIRGFQDEVWPAVFDVTLDRGLELLRAGFMKMVSRDDESGHPVKTFRAVYRRKEMSVKCEGLDSRADRQQRVFPKIERNGTRHSLYQSLGLSEGSRYSLFQSLGLSEDRYPPPI
ncbi:hypothetical protein MN608_09441 [Microdochium nivale]|nr:hypothetical protein MN608_09441 [Microdochium nivale]